MFLVVACYANAVLAADEKLEKLLLSSGGSRHRLSIHRKKSERHRHMSSENVYPMPEEQLLFTEEDSNSTHEDILDDGPMARRSLRNEQKKRKKNRSDNKSHRAKDKDSSGMKRGANKDRNHDKKKKDDEAEKDKRKKEKTNKTKEDDVKQKKKKGRARDKMKKKKSDGKDGLLHKNNGDNSSWDDWGHADDEDWKSSHDWGHLGCICEDWWATSEDWETSPDDWESADKPLIRDLTTLAEKFAVTEIETYKKDETVQITKSNSDEKQKLKMQSDNWSWEESSESWDWWSVDSWSSSSSKSSKSKSSKSKTGKSKSSKWCPCSPSVSPSPSSSSSPSSQPSSHPTDSLRPSDSPSNEPSSSFKPSSEPSETPSRSAEPSSEPSLSPSTSAQPSSQPSSAPSESSQPSDEPSEIPSLSAEPSSEPSLSPSTQPSTSSAPSSAPSNPPSTPPPGPAELVGRDATKDDHTRTEAIGEAAFPTHSPTPYLSPYTSNEENDLTSHPEISDADEPKFFGTPFPTPSQVGGLTSTYGPTTTSSENTDREVTPAESSCSQDFCTIEVSDECTLAYRVNDGFTITVELTCDGSDEWVGIGFSKDGQMQNSEAVLGVPGHQPLKYALNGKYTAAVIQMPEHKQTLMDATLEVNQDGRTVMKFTKILKEHMIEDEEEIFLLYAKGMSSTLGYHPNRSSFKLAL